LNNEQLFAIIYLQSEKALSKGVYTRDMKLVAKPIDAIVIFRSKGHPVPYKFKYKDDLGEDKEIYVGRIIFVDERRLAGTDMLVYECQSKVDDFEKRYQLKYYIPNCKWELYKI